MMTRVVDCSFQRFSCGHDLFSPTYTRSNRTKGTKIMRCFPHCCPEHMPRCYCGCSLHVVVTFEDLSVVDLDDVIVCARFETSEQQAPRLVTRLGSTLTIPRVLLSRDADDANATSWIVAEKESEIKQREGAKNSVLFVMNNHRFPRWYYGYESGATKNQRDMRHHLTAYVLLRSSQVSSTETDSQRVLVIGRLPSPAFKLVSYRRARGDVKNPQALPHDQSLADHGSSTEDEHGMDASHQATPTKTRRIDEAASPSSSAGSPALSSRSIETRGADVPAPLELSRRHSTPSNPLVLEEKAALSVPVDGDMNPVSRKRKAARSPAAKTLWWRHHADDAQRVLHLDVLFVLLHRLSLRDVMFCLHTKSERLRKKWFTAIATATTPLSPAGSTRLAELARAFCLSVFSEGAEATPAESAEVLGDLEHATSLEVIATCVEVLLEVSTSAAVQQLLEATWQTHKHSVLESDVIRDLFVQFVRRLHGAIDTTLRNRRADTSSGSSIPTVSGNAPVGASACMAPQQEVPGGVAALVDDAMATAFREQRLVSLRRDMVRTMSDPAGAAERWHEVFVAQLRTAWVHHHERKASGISLLWQAALNTRHSVWAGKWVLDSSSYRVRRAHPGGWLHQPPQNHAAAAAPPLGSVVSWIALLRQWLAVELTMNGNVLAVSSLLTGSTARASMQLILDERQRVFQSFPDGMASTISLGGGDFGAWLHGDYVGRGNDTTPEMLCETYSIRQQHQATDGDRTTEMLRLAVKASISDLSAVTRRYVVSVQLATATCSNLSAPQLLTWSVLARHERLYAHAHWSVVADVEAAYLHLT